MESEVPTLPASIQRGLSPKINDYRISFEEMKRHFSKCEEAFNLYIQKARLFAESNENSESLKKKGRNANSNNSTKEKLIKTGNMIKSQGKDLKEANRTALDTESLVFSVQNELKKNKETLHRTLKTVISF